MRDRERLDPRVRVERAQHPPHVVADGVGAQVELSAICAVERPVPAGAGPRSGAASGAGVAFGAASVSRCVTTPNTPTILPPSRRGTALIFDLDTLAAGSTTTTVASVDCSVPIILRRNDSLAARALLGHDHGRLLAPANVAHEPVARN
jgi:hypothetical protein